MKRAFLAFPIALFTSLALAQETPLVREDFILNPTCRETAPAALAATGAKQLRIAEYNVENLFDPFHDANKEDYEYLAVDSPDKALCEGIDEGYRAACYNTHWGEDTFAKKIELLAESFAAQYESPAAYPDILVLTEIENPRAVLTLAKRLGYITELPAQMPAQNTDYSKLYAKGAVKCQDLGPNVVMTNSPDVRGIDVAIIHRAGALGLKRVSCKEHLVPNADKPTRNVIAAEYLVKGNRLTVLGNHWPSQGGPTSSRTKASKLVRKLFEKAYKRGHVVATGDFNTIAGETPHPIDRTLLSSRIVRDLNKVKSTPAEGTYYYGVNVDWNHLDRIFVSRSMLRAKASLRVNPETFRAHRQAALTAPSKITYFRDAAAIAHYQAVTGQTVRYPNPPEQALDPRIAAHFAARPDLEVLDIQELCAPKRMSNFKNRDGQYVLSGFSDHFAVSVDIDVTR